MVTLIELNGLKVLVNKWSFQGGGLRGWSLLVVGYLK